MTTIGWCKTHKTPVDERWCDDTCDAPLMRLVPADITLYRSDRLYTVDVCEHALLGTHRVDTATGFYVCTGTTLTPVGQGGA